MTAIALLVFTARYCILIRQPSVRQILERLFDFVVFQFDTPLEKKKAGTFDFLKSSGFADLFVIFNMQGLHNSKTASENKKRRIVDSTKPTIRRLNFVIFIFLRISKYLSKIRSRGEIKWLKTRFG